jgi:hypothetical protein
MLVALALAHGIAVAQPAPAVPTPGEAIAPTVPTPGEAIAPTVPTPGEAIAPGPDGVGSAAKPLTPAPNPTQAALLRKPVELTKKRYGHVVFLGDLAALFAYKITAQKADNDTVTAVVALGGINLGAPLIHAGYDNWSGAAWSFGLRATTSVLTYLAYKAPCKDGPCGVGTFFVGGLGGVIIMSVDYFKLAKVSRKATPAKKTSVMIQPTLHIGPESTGFALAGSF